MLTDAHKQMVAVSEERFRKVKALIKQGTKITEAIRQTEIDPSTYYRLARTNGKHVWGTSKLRGTKKRKKRVLLQVENLPAPQTTPALFMVFGSPEMLTSFARSLN